MGLAECASLRNLRFLVEVWPSSNKRVYDPLSLTLMTVAFLSQRPVVVFWTRRMLPSLNAGKLRALSLCSATALFSVSSRMMDMLSTSRSAR